MIFKAVKNKDVELKEPKGKLKLKCRRETDKKRKAWTAKNYLKNRDCITTESWQKCQVRAGEKVPDPHAESFVLLMVDTNSMYNQILIS